jgi:hypothetical protein
VSRYRAALIHLFISAVIVGIAVATIHWVWYPQPSFEILSTIYVARVLFFITLLIGPLLTLVVYKQRKAGLMFDLSVIVLLQITTLAYGMHTLYEARPYYLVFAVDRLEFVARNRVDQSAIRSDELRQKSLGQFVRVFARRPEDPEEFQRYVDGIVNDGLPDLERRAEFWEPWAAGADVIRRTIRPIEDITPASPDERQNLQQAIGEFAQAHPNLGVLPVGGVEKDIGMLLDRDSLEILGALNINPWRTQGPSSKTDEPP